MAMPPPADTEPVITHPMTVIEIKPNACQVNAFTSNLRFVSMLIAPVLHKQTYSHRIQPENSVNSLH